MNKLRASMALTISALIVGAIPAHVAAQDEAAPSIEGPVWELVDFGEDGAAVRGSLSMEDGTATIFGGCNSYFGSYELDGQSLSFGEEFTSTLAQCEPHVMDSEHAYIDALGEVASYGIQDDTVLLLNDADGATVLQFTEAAAATVDDLALLGFEIDKAQARINAIHTSLHDLRQHVHDTDVRGEVKALEAHLNELTKQHINQRNHQVELRRRIHNLETQVDSMITTLAAQGLVPEGD